MSNPLLTTLQIIQELGQNGPKPTNILMLIGEISDASVKRYVAEARTMGADITVVSSHEGHRYTLNNWSEVQEKTNQWIELEISRELRSGVVG